VLLIERMRLIEVLSIKQSLPPHFPLRPHP
jgi:hypothetical protein